MSIFAMPKVKSVINPQHNSSCNADLCQNHSAAYCMNEGVTSLDKDMFTSVLDIPHSPYLMDTTGGKLMGHTIGVCGGWMDRSPNANVNKI